MALPRASAAAMLGLASVYGCSSGGSAASPTTPSVEAPTVESDRAPRLDLSRARGRSPGRFAFQPTPTGYVAQQERDIAIFSEGAMIIQDLGTGETVGLSTGFVGRDRNLWTGPADEGIDDDGAVIVTRGNLVERYKTFRAATMQSWHFASQPSGRGDLHVRVNVGNVTSAEEFENGIKLHTAAATFLYELATWVDANNTRTVIEPKWTGKEIEITVPASVIAASTYPAMLDPLVGPWSPTPTITPAYAPAVGSDGTDYIVVWEDYTTCKTAGSCSSATNGTRIMARRYDGSTGAAKDTTPITVWAVAGTTVQGEPSVAFDGTNYMVAFWDATM